MKNLKIVIITIIVMIVITSGIYIFVQKQNNVKSIINEETCGQGTCTDISDLKYGYDVGDVIPNLTLHDFSNNEVKLYDLLEGYDKIIISLQADWCSDCHRQNDKITQDDAIPENVLFIPIFTKYSIKGDESKTSTYENSKKYAEKEFSGTNIIPYYDTGDVFYNKFNVKGTPTNIVLNTSARIKMISLEYDADTLMLENTETTPRTKENK